jgi:FtsH-binding integral membrane protein
MAHPVFDRSTGNPPGRSLSPSIYNLLIGLVLLWGFGINYLMLRTLPVSTLTQINPIAYYIAYFALTFLGVILFRKSTNPFVSFLGYNLVVVPFGTVINLVVTRYDSAIVVEAVQITALVTLTMMILGTLFPRFFVRIAFALGIALLVTFLIQLANIFYFKRELAALDWIVALIFCGYIGYDWGRANQIPKTVDNAIDSAASLYMDIINLFLRILRILGRRR